MTGKAYARGRSAAIQVLSALHRDWMDRGLRDDGLRLPICRGNEAAEHSVEECEPPAGKQELNMKVHTIKMGFVKSYLICGEAGCILVDAGIKKDAKALLAGLQKISIQPEDIKLIVITHAHGDHVGGLMEMKKKTGAPILIHKREAPFLLEGISAPIYPRKRILKFFIKTGMQAAIPALKADLTMDDEFSLAAYGVDAKVIHTPGHTPGSLTVIAGKDALIGDTAMKIGVLSGRSYVPVIAEDMGQVERSWRRILECGVETIHPSHGKSFQAAHMKDMLEVISKRIHNLRGEG